MKKTGRDWQILSLLGLFVSAVVWWFIDGQVYDACAFGPEYTLLFDVPNGPAPTTFAIAVGSSLCGLGCAIRASRLKPKRKLYVWLLIATHLSVSPLGWLEIQHTAATTDLVDLQNGGRLYA